MNLRQYLKPGRTGSQHWQLRYMVPKAVRPILGRREFTKAIRAVSREEASTLALPLLQEWKSAIDRAFATLTRGENYSSVRPVSVGSTVPTIIDLQIAAANAGYSTILGKLQDLRGSKSISTNTAYERYYTSLGEQLLRLVRTRETDAQFLWEKVADRQIERSGWLLPKGSDLYTEFLNMISEASIEAVRIEIERGKGNLGAEPNNKTVLAGLSGDLGSAKPGETIMELFDRYAAQRLAEGRKRVDTINQDRKIVDLFAEFVGPTSSLDSISRANVRNWRDTLSNLPANYRKMTAYKGMGLKEASAKGKTEGAKGLSPPTVNKYLSTISPFFSWAQTNGYADHNPCDDLFYDLVKGKNPRPPFSIDQLNTILESPLFNGFLQNGSEHVKGELRSDDWRYWIPLACLFTGARIGEIAQLQVGDVIQEQGVWFIHIRNDESTGQVTKSGHSRPAPVHSQLQMLGFVRFVDNQAKRAAKDGNPQLFPELKPNNRGHVGAVPSRFWRTYLNRIGVKSGSDGLGAHSFRHTMADQLRLAGYLDDQIEVALGHNQKTTTSGYGRLKQGTVTMLHDMFEAVKFEGVHFSHLTTSIHRKESNEIRFG